jgi:eukaryotic-like serine/threonine-protein kinase
VPDEERTEVRPPAPAEAPAPTEVSTPEASDGLTVAQNDNEVAAALERSRLGLELAPPVRGYRPVRKLGQGTYGQVWLYREERTGIQVAIKFFDRSRGQEWLLLQAEVKQLALLNADPGIVQLKDVEPDADPPYYVMAYAPGGSLADRLAGGQKLSVPEALALFRQVAEALAYVHAKGVRHCDLKPGNVLLDARGRALVADFGQAHLSCEASPALGTFFYMAPEQANLDHQIPDTRWDVYSLGALFYAMVTGRPPRATEELRRELADTADLAARLRRYREEIARQPKPEAHRRVPGMDGVLAELISRCLEIDPARRPHDAGAVLAALDLRDRRRSQRPLLVFGLAAPVLLLLFMAFAGLLGSEQAIDRSQEQLTDQLLESDCVAARLIANAVQEQLGQRIELLKGSAGRPLYEATRHERQGELERLLVQVMATAQKTNSKFTEATVSNADGVILAVVQDGNGRPAPVPPYRKRPQYSWRDWFSGTGDRWGETDRHHPPICDVHISDPYVSSIDKNMFISISVPVRVPESEPWSDPVGVLEAAIKLDDVNQWLREVRMKNAGSIVLLDRRRYVVMHREENRDAILPRKADAKAADGELPPVFDFTNLQEAIEQEKQQRRLHGDSRSWNRRLGGVLALAPHGPLAVLPPLYLPEDAISGTMRQYQDPVDGKHYLAGFAQFKDLKIGWVALVQHETAATLQPIQQLRGEMHGIGWRLFGVAGLLTAALWGWLFWMLRRAEHVAYG